MTTVDVCRVLGDPRPSRPPAPTSSNSLDAALLSPVWKPGPGSTAETAVSARGTESSNTPPLPSSLPPAQRGRNFHSDWARLTRVSVRTSSRVSVRVAASGGARIVRQMSLSLLFMLWRKVVRSNLGVGREGAEGGNWKERGDWEGDPWAQVRTSTCQLSREERGSGSLVSLLGIIGACEVAGLERTFSGGLCGVNAGASPPSGELWMTASSVASEPSKETVSWCVDKGMKSLEGTAIGLLYLCHSQNRLPRSSLVLAAEELRCSVLGMEFAGLGGWATGWTTGIPWSSSKASFHAYSTFYVSCRHAPNHPSRRYDRFCSSWENESRDPKTAWQDRRNRETKPFHEEKELD